MEEMNWFYKMIIVINPKKTLVITSIGICLVGSLFAALKLYYRATNRKIHKKSNRSGSIKPADNSKKPIRLSENYYQNEQDAKNEPLPAEELLELGFFLLILFLINFFSFY